MSDPPATHPPQAPDGTPPFRGVAAEALGTLFEAASEALVITDQEGRIRAVNTTAERLFGYSRDELLGEPIEELVPVAYRERHLVDRARYMERPESRPMGYRAELFGRRKDGSLVPVRIGLSHARAAGETFVMAVVIDVTELKRARRDLQEYTRQLERSNQELEQFASVASHDLQEPLRKIQAFGERLRDRCAGTLDERAQDYLARMENAAGRMRVLIDDLLTFSRITTRAQPPVAIDLGRIAREVLSDLESRVDDLGGEVIVGELPTIHADPLQMRQLLQNLIGNGLKFHRPGVPPRVEVQGRIVEDDAGDRVARITVTDEGIGFDPKYAERIFDLFQRLHGRGAYEGTGIGLAVCKKIAERHGGSIRARSEPDRGTTMTVMLPIAAQGDHHG